MPKIRPCEPRSPSGRRRRANCPTVVNIGLVRQARVALGTLREVVIIDGDANIAPFATLSSAEVEATTKQTPIQAPVPTPSFTSSAAAYPNVGRAERARRAHHHALGVWVSSP
jgi:hypothetical protein